jgi:carboxyl-terminal processing protease
MPRRNLTIIILAAIASIVCYQRADRNPYTTVFSQALHIISQNYVEPVEQRELFEGALEGMARKLDPNSQYIPPKKYKLLQEQLDQAFGGVGIEISGDETSQRIKIVRVLHDTPAARAGLKPNDLIIAIDGDDLLLDGKTPSARRDQRDEGIKRMRGKIGEPVEITVQRPEIDVPLAFEIVRDRIETESVMGDTRNEDDSWNFFVEDHPNLGYIRIKEFGGRTAAELLDALKFSGKDVDGLILDLRDNGGGLLESAVEVCDLFIDDGLIVRTVERGGVEAQAWYAEPGNSVVRDDLPLVVLINGQTASAAEIVAACLQDYERAIVVGERSYGKGTVQKIFHLEGGRSAMKITTASYWRPSGKNIHRGRNVKKEDKDWGVWPNEGHTVKLEGEQLEQVFTQRIRRGAPPSVRAQDEKAENVEDPQLNRAIEILTTES